MLLTDGIEFIQVTIFNFNKFTGILKGDVVSLSKFMIRHTQINEFWFRLNETNIHLDNNAGSAVKKINYTISDVPKYNFADNTVLNGKNLVNLIGIVMNTDTSLFKGLQKVFIK